MKNRQITVGKRGVALAILMILMLVACGPDDGAADTAVPATDNEPAVAPTADAEADDSGAGDTDAGDTPPAGPLVVDSGGEVPFYARFGENETFDDGDWTVIVFYRPPDCIPADFNLNEFFHFPSDAGPGAFGCAPPTVTGVETWQNGPDVDPAPLEAEMTGSGAVPVWFVKWSELEQAMADGETTIDELAGLPSRLVGTATTYSEFLRPSQSNEAPMIAFSAEGTLEDGAAFQVDVSKGAPDVDDHVTIEIDEN